MPKEVNETLVAPRLKLGDPNSQKAPLPARPAYGSNQTGINTDPDGRVN